MAERLWESRPVRLERPHVQEEGLTYEEASSLVQKFFQSRRRSDNPPAPKTRISKANKSKAPSPPRKSVSNEAEFLNFSQSVHMLNQEAHKQMRRNKAGIRLTDVEPEYRNVGRGSERPVSRAANGESNNYCDNVSRAKNSVRDQPKHQFGDSSEEERQRFSPNGDSPTRPPSKSDALRRPRNCVKHPNQYGGSQIDLRDLLRRKGEDEVDICGPYNFRQLLRPAKHLPTESLRKRKGVVPNEYHTQLIHFGDSPVKRRAHKY